MEQSSCIDYKGFLAKRYDLVVKYHLITDAGWSFEKARGLIIESEEYAFMYDLYRKLWPVLSKKFDSRLKEKYGHDTGLALAHNQFLLKNFKWIERAVRKGDWLRERPYGLRLNNEGIPSKRFLVTLKYDKKLWWCQEPFLDGYKASYGPTRDRNNYEAFLTSEQFAMFEAAKFRLMKHMGRLRFFFEETRIRVKLEDYEK